MAAVAAALAFEPLRLRYAFYRVANTDYRSTDPLNRGRWLLLSMDAAKQGNPRAMDLLVDRYDVTIARPTSQGIELPSVGYLVALEQPQVFMRTLDSRSDERTLAILWRLNRSLYEGQAPYWPVLKDDRDTARFLVQHLEHLAQCHAREGRQPQNLLAQEAAAYVRRRFKVPQPTKK